MFNEQEIIKRYQDGQGVNKIKREMSLSGIKVIYNILEKHNIQVKKNLGIDEKKLIELYNNGITSAVEMSRIFGIPKVNINYYFKKLKLHSITPREDLNENFFEKIDTEHKAYCLGLWYSDGNVYIGTNGNQSKKYNYKFKALSLYMIDLDIIQKVKHSLNYKGIIRIRRDKRINKYGEKYKIIYGIRIASNKMCKDIIEKGCVPRKSLIIKLPENIIPPLLMRHFIRGVFDGDGGISRCNNGMYNIYITGTKMLMEDIQKFLPCNSGICKYKNSSVYQLYISSKDNKKCFLDYIYKDATIYIDRKKELAEKFYKEWVND